MRDGELMEGEVDVAGSSDGVYVSTVPEMGRGLFAKRAYEAGECILLERPLVAMQSLHNAQDVMVCRNCFAFLGSVLSQLELLGGTSRQECLANLLRRQEEAAGTGKSPTLSQDGWLAAAVPCADGCGEIYCGMFCRDAHFRRCHAALCVGAIPDVEAADHPLVQFRIHAASTNEILLLVGEVVATVAAAWQRHVSKSVSESSRGGGSGGSGGNIAANGSCSSSVSGVGGSSWGAGGGDDSGAALAAVLMPFRDFVQEPWWDVAITPAPVAPGAQEELATALRGVCEASAALLAAALKPPPSLAPVFSAEFFGRVVGMFEQNNVGIRVANPVPAALRAAVKTAEMVAAAVVTAGDGGGESQSGAGSRKTKDAGGTSSGLSDLVEEAAAAETFLAKALPLVHRVAWVHEGEEEEDDDGDESCCSGGSGEGHDHHHHHHGRQSGNDKEAGSSNGDGSDEADIGDGAEGGECEEEKEEDEHGSEGGLATAAARLSRLLQRLEGGGDRCGGGSGGGGEFYAAAAAASAFPPLDGTALYTLVCCMNHSCDPNCEVVYRTVGGGGASDGSGGSNGGNGGGGSGAAVAAAVMARRPVAAGEQLLQSYIDAAAPVAERWEALRDYGFVCRCPRCRVGEP